MSLLPAPSRTFFLPLLIALSFLLAAASAQAQPTLSKVFTPATIGPGSVSTITFTITNGGGAPITGLAFTDALPAGVTIADPAAAGTNCDLGGGGSVDAPDGGSAITLSGAQLGAFQSCTILVDVTSSTPGVHTNPAITLSSSAGSSMSTAADLTVDAARTGFSKSFAPSSIPLGGRSTLTFTFDNTANAQANTFLSFTDTFPTGMVVADPSNVSSDCGMINFNFTAIPGSSSVSLLASGAAAPGLEVIPAGAACTIDVDVVATTAGMLDNVTSDLTIRVGNSFTNLSAGKASDTLEVTVSELALIKQFTDDPVPSGGNATMELTILNRDRDFDATGVGFTDDLTTVLAGLIFDSVLSNGCGPSVTGIGGTTVTVSGVTVPAQGSCTLVVSLAVPSGAAPGAYPNTTSAVSGTVDGSPRVGNMASDVLFVSPAPVLTKVFLDNPVGPGDTTELEFTVTNTSLTSAATDVAFTDVFPVILPTASVTPGNGCCGAGSTCSFVAAGANPAFLSVTGGTLAAAGTAGDSCTFSVTLNVAGAAALGTYTNTTTEITATVDGETRTGSPATDDLLVIAAPDLHKAFTDDPVLPGGTVTLEFTLTAAAEAPSNATGITFTDDLASVLAGLTANLPPTPDPPCGAGSTLTASAGDTLLTLMGGTLAPGESCAFSVTLDVPVGAAPGSYTNTTSGVSATVAGEMTTSQPASDDLDIPGLLFSKQFLGDPVIPGDTVSLRFTLDNVHPTDDATSIAFSDNLNTTLAGLTRLGSPTVDTCGGAVGGSLTNLSYSGGSVLSGQACTIEILLQVPGGAADGDYPNVTSNLSAVQSAPIIVDPATDLLTVTGDLLLLTKQFTDDPVAAGDTVTLEFVLTNLDAGQAASGIGFTDDLGAALTGLTFGSVLLDTCGGTVGGLGTDMVTVSGVALAAGASCTLRLSLTVPGGAADGVYVNTTSDVSGTIGGLAVGGDAASDELDVVPLLLFSKSFDGPSTATGTATLTFTITNPGSDTAGGISFTDNLDDVISGLIATSLPPLPCGAASSISGVSLLTFSGGELPPMGGTCSFDVDVLVPASATAGTYPNVTSDLFRSGLLVAGPATADLVIEPPPAFDKVFMPGVVGPGVPSTLVFTIDNTASSLAATGLDFTDNLPAGMQVAGFPNASTTCGGGTLTAAAGSAVITYTGGSVAAASTCTVQVDVTASTTGFFNNTTGDLTSSSGNSGTAGATLAVDPPPGFDKNFSPNKIGLGAVSTLTFTIDNSFATVDATGLDFTDNLPAAVMIATPSNAATDCTGGTLTAADGTGVVTYTGGSVGSGASCTVEVDVTSSTVGQHVNVSGALTSSLGNSGTANATLDVNPPPLFSKSFAPNPSIIGGLVTLTFTIDNTASTAAATILAFADNLPAALLVATPANVANGCGGTVTASDGTGTITLVGGTVGSGALCTISVDIVSSSAGDHANTTGDLTSSLGNSGTASDTLRVNPPPGFSKAFQPMDLPIGTVGTLVLSINNSSSTVDATSVDFVDNLPADVVVATPANVSNTCSGGIVTATAGTGVVSYTGGTVLAGAGCAISVDITSDILGTYVNLTGDLTSSLGNSGTAEATLNVVDVEPPVLTAITTANGALAECDDLRLPVSTIAVSIEDDASPIVGADNAANYLLIASGADGDFSTSSCAGGVVGDDVPVALLDLFVDDTDPLAIVAELVVADAEGLAPGLYRFFVCGTIADAAGNLLAGGDAEVASFRSNPRNLFVNGHFDDCPLTLDPWTVTATPLNAVQTGSIGADDFAGSPLSASAHFVQVQPEASSLAQCVAVAGDALYDLEGWLRYDAPSGALAIYEQSCEFFDGAGCSGTSVGAASIASLLENAGPAWDFSEITFHTPSGAASALCSFVTGPLGGDPLFNLYIDGLFVGGSNATELFSDGFESGDTSAWSSTVP